MYFSVQHKVRMVGDYVICTDSSTGESCLTFVGLGPAETMEGKDGWRRMLDEASLGELIISRLAEDWTDNEATKIFLENIQDMFRGQPDCPYEIYGVSVNPIGPTFHFRYRDKDYDATVSGLMRSDIEMHIIPRSQVGCYDLTKKCVVAFLEDGSIRIDSPYTNGRRIVQLAPNYTVDADGKVCEYDAIVEESWGDES